MHFLLLCSSKIMQVFEAIKGILDKYLNFSYPTHLLPPPWKNETFFPNFEVTVTLLEKCLFTYAQRWSDHGAVLVVLLRAERFYSLTPYIAPSDKV